MMGTRVNKKTYEKMVEEDIEWLMKNTEPSLERYHILGILKASTEFYYGKQAERLKAKDEKGL
jgi:hypothetical protein